MTRPGGPLKIRKTDLVDENVLVGRLTGSVRCKVASVKKGEKYFMVAPEKLGGTQEIPADSLTDCMNFGVWMMGEELKLEKRRKALKASKAKKNSGNGHGKA